MTTKQKNLLAEARKIYISKKSINKNNDVIKGAIILMASKYSKEDRLTVKNELKSVMKDFIIQEALSF